MIRVLRDFIAVRKQNSETKSAGGLHLVHLDEEKTVTGEVVAVGSGHLMENGSEPLEVAVGDRVVFSKSLAVEVKDGEDAYLVLRESNVLAVLG